MAERIGSTRALITDDANLDIDAWTRLHFYTPLYDSLTTATLGALPPRIRQLHLVGSRDTNIPPSLVRTSLQGSGKQVVVARPSPPIIVVAGISFGRTSIAISAASAPIRQNSVMGEAALVGLKPDLPQTALPWADLWRVGFQPEPEAKVVSTFLEAILGHADKRGESSCYSNSQRTPTSIR